MVNQKTWKSVCYSRRPGVTTRGRNSNRLEGEGGEQRSGGTGCIQKAGRHNGSQSCFCLVCTERFWAISFLSLEIGMIRSQSLSDTCRLNFQPKARFSKFCKGISSYFILFWLFRAINKSSLWSLTLLHLPTPHPHTRETTSFGRTNSSWEQDAHIQSHGSNQN